MARARSAIVKSRSRNQGAGRLVVGILGGTFDPVHRGHIALGQWLYETGAFAGVHYLVNAVPPQRPPPSASAAQRLAMLKLALADRRGLYVDDRELQRPGPSYTVETLALIRNEMGVAQPLALIMGEDALAGLQGWHHWQRLAGLAHLVVLRRDAPAKDEAARASLLEALRMTQVDSPHALGQAPTGLLWCAKQPVTPEAATAIRAKVHTAGEAVPELPQAVARYIKTAGLYRRLAPSPKRGS